MKICVQLHTWLKKVANTLISHSVYVSTFFSESLKLTPTHPEKKWQEEFVELHTYYSQVIRK